MEIAEFEALIAAAVEARGEIDRIKTTELAPRERELAELEGKILQTLQDHEMSSYRSAHGTVVRSTRYAVRTPKTLEEKQAFFGWLREKKGEEVFWQYASVNSQSLNAFYKAEMDIAKEERNFGFKIPGLGQPEATPILSIRKK
jgi:hypothetical protein